MLLDKQLPGEFAVSIGRCFLGKHSQRQKKTLLVIKVLITWKGVVVRSLTKQKH